MKQTICDICHYRHKKLIKATRRVGWKGSNSVRIDTCENHHTIFKDENVTCESSLSWLDSLIRGEQE